MSLEQISSILYATVQALAKRHHLGPYPGELLPLAFDISPDDWQEVLTLGTNLGLLTIDPRGRVGLTDKGMEASTKPIWLIKERTN